ncbi:hypothetical protein MMC18_003082 [Xylographa bjoerkii]|nr:hypothetical protein [Xylographa bjoerkii]
MSLLLAPYNDSMRLGMGFNSYTQTMCIDGAVAVKSKNEVKTKNPSQVVTYSSKFVERLSDIVSSMNISYSSAIKKGTIEVAGNGNSIDEDKIKASDINLVVSVQVINQTTILENSAEFQELANVQPDSQAFNEAFGDCYISGFIEGGDFSSIISMRCIDRTKTNSVVRAIKKMAKSSEPEDFSMDSYSFSNSFSTSDALKDTETTMSVNWMGGGQIKNGNTTWDVNSVFAAAAAFPQNVAKTPQRTWAILTKYKANRSFNAWAMSKSLRPLEYDAVISYTAELFNNFMEFKQLIKKVQDIITHRDDYTISPKANAIPTNVPTLVAVRSALRNEMNKIVAVNEVNILSRKPELLQQASSFNIVSKNALVRKIMQEAISASPDIKVILDTTEAAAVPAPGPTADSKPPSVADSADSVGDFDTINHADVKTPASEEPPAISVRKPTSAAPSLPVALAPTQSEQSGVKIDLSQLIAPEIWADLLPVRNKTSSFEDNNVGALAAPATMFPAPPKDDAVAFLTVDKTKLQIHAAVCGIQDLTAPIRSRIVDKTTLNIKVNEIDGLARSPVYDSLEQPFIKNLSLIYQYGDGPLRFLSANYNENSSETITITAKSEHTQLTPRVWNSESWSIVGVVYGGKLYTDESKITSVEDAIRKDYSQSSYGARRVYFNNNTFGENPWPGFIKTGVVFYRAEEGEQSLIRAAVGIQDSEPAALTLQPQLAVLQRVVDREVVKEVPKEVIKEVPVQVIKEVPVEVIKEVPREVIKEVRVPGPSRVTVIFDKDRLRVSGSDTPFLRFENGLKFSFKPDGNFVVYNSNGACAWATDKYKGSAGGKELRWQGDGNLVAYADNEALWSSNTYGSGQTLVLANEKPFVQVLNSSGSSVYSSW